MAIHLRVSITTTLPIRQSSGSRVIRPVQVGFPLPAQLARLGRPLAERGRQATATAADGVGCIGGPETGHGVPGTSLAIACLRLAL